MSADDPEREERELEALLGRVEPHRPSPEARAEARRAFLAGAPLDDASRAASAGRTGEVMPEPMGPQASWSADELDGFVVWLRAHRAPPRPRPEALRRARLAFLSAVASAPPAPPPSRSYRALVLLAAAAAILLVTILVPAPDRWRVQLDGGIVLEGSEYGLGEEDRLAAELEQSGWLETGATRARLVLGGVLELELLPGSSLYVPPLPALDGLAALDFELARGEAFLRTRGAYPGNPIRIRTELAEVVLSGTTVGVLVDEAGTCVCVADGSVRVTSARGAEELGARHSLRFFRDATRAPESGPFAGGSGPEAAHVQELLAFQGEP